MKVCSRCGTEKEYSEYGKRKSSPDGYNPACRQCLRSNDRARYRNPPPKREVTREGDIKRCNTCREWKHIDDYSNRSDTPDGKKYRCRACDAGAAVAFRKSNPESATAAQRRYYAKNHEALVKKAAKWTLDNRERVNKHRRESGWGAASTAKYRNARKTPAWADTKKINRIYRLAREITVLTGVPHEVDHAIPVQGKMVTGLHVETNLQIMPASDNRSKGNRQLVSKR